MLADLWIKQLCSLSDTLNTKDTESQSLKRNMPTGPFRDMGTFDVKDHQGNTPKNGPSSKNK